MARITGVDKLKEEITEMYKVSEKVKVEGLQGTALDVANAKKMRDMIFLRGEWFPISQVGEQIAGMAWVVVHHADNDRLLQKMALQLMSELPYSDVNRKYIAMLDDRIAIAEGRKQTYGAQFQPDGKGGCMPCPIADENGVNDRRKRMNFDMTLEEYATLMQKSYTATIEARKKKIA